MLVSLGTWSVVSPLVHQLCVHRRLDLICSPTQDDMPTEDSRGAAASTDCRRTAPHASTHEAQGLRVTIVMNPIHGDIFAT